MRIKLRKFCDFHTHLRSPAQIGSKPFGFVVRKNCSHYRFVVAEPNTYLDRRRKTHHIETAEDLVKYSRLVEDARVDANCTVLYLLKLTPKTTPSIVREAATLPKCVGFKMYPEGVTVGSQHGGVSDFFSEEIYASLREMELSDLVLQIHPEMPHRFCLRREHDFHSVLIRYVRDFPQLRIFVEHVTDRRTVELVHQLRMGGARIWMTITGHHLHLTLDDVLGHNEHHCWPCAKEPEDKARLIMEATSGNQAAISITDSAPWDWRSKHIVVPACAGVFNPAEIAIPWLVTLFERNKRLDRLGPFASDNGRNAYALQHSDSDADQITLVKETWRVPQEYRVGKWRITPFLAGQEELPWRIAK